MHCENDQSDTQREKPIRDYEGNDIEKRANQRRWQQSHTEKNQSEAKKAKALKKEPKEKNVSSLSTEYNLWIEPRPLLDINQVLNEFLVF